jgi:hypothetical protein
MQRITVFLPIVMILLVGCTGTGISSPPEAIPTTQEIFTPDIPIDPEL